jgi:hypothetical protein
VLAHFYRDPRPYLRAHNNNFGATNILIAAVEQRTLFLRQPRDPVHYVYRAPINT